MKTHIHQYTNADGRNLITIVVQDDISSTNTTMSNIPGPGRILNNVFHFYGRKLEVLLGRLATTAGLGPDALYRQISSNLRDCCHPGRAEKASAISHTARKSVLRKCLKLIEHTHSPIFSTQQKALHHIIHLTLEYPDVQECFRQQGAVSHLHTIPLLLALRRCNDEERDILLSSSRKALYCIEQNSLNTSGKVCREIISYWNMRARLSPTTINNIHVIILTLVAHLRNILSFQSTELRFISERYMGTCCDADEWWTMFREDHYKLVRVLLRQSRHPRTLENMDMEGSTSNHFYEVEITLHPSIRGIKVQECDWNSSGSKLEAISKDVDQHAYNDYGGLHARVVPGLRCEIRRSVFVQWHSITHHDLLTKFDYM